MLAGCGSAPEKQNAKTEEATRLSARADAAFQQGNYEKARKDYQLALRINESIENAAQIAIIHVNLARVLREMGQPDQAHLQLDALFSDSALPCPPGTLAAAAAMKSKLYLESNEPSLSLSWAAKGEEYCQANCQVAGSLLLIRAQLAQRDNRLDDAEKLAGSAASVLATAGQNMELANAQRLAGEVRLAKNDFAGATQLFQQALAVDQKLGAPGKIRLDLLRLGTSYERAGDVSAAMRFYTRALTVSDAMGSGSASEEVRAYIKGLQKDAKVTISEPR